MYYYLIFLKPGDIWELLQGYTVKKQTWIWTISGCLQNFCSSCHHYDDLSKMTKWFPSFKTLQRLPIALPVRPPTFLPTTQALGTVNTWPLSWRMQHFMCLHVLLSRFEHISSPTSPLHGGKGSYLCFICQFQLLTLQNKPSLTHPSGVYPTHSVCPMFIVHAPTVALVIPSWHYSFTAPTV